MKKDEGNKIIAEFMGFEPREKYLIQPNVPKTALSIHVMRGEALTVEDLRYDCDWSWLMPVVENICRIKIGNGIEQVDFAYPRTFGVLDEETGDIMVRLNGFPLHEAKTLIAATWEAVVEYIQS